MVREVEDIIKKVNGINDDKYEVISNDKKDANLVKSQAMLNSIVKNVKVTDSTLFFGEAKSDNMHATQSKKIFCTAFKLSTAKFGNKKFLELADK